MASSLKGNLGLSSLVAPTSAKLTTQYIVEDHMNNHYKKLSKAKAAIDNKPPKSLQTSQKMRDRRNRNRMMTVPRAHSSMEMRDDELHLQYREIFNEEPEDEEERLVHSIMRSTLDGKPKGSNNATYGSNTDNTYMTSDQVSYSMGDTHPMTNGYTMFTKRPQSARSYRSGHSGVSITSRTPITHDTSRITYKGDILQTRAHKFSDPGRPFTPRTNITKAESKLKNSSCYNPPRVKSAGKKSSHTEPAAHPRPKAAPRGSQNPKGNNGLSYTQSSYQDGLETGQLSESMLMDMSLRSRDDHSNRDGMDHQVPRLDISMDTDHSNWLKEQANKATVRARSGARIPVTEEDIAEESSSLNQSINRTRSLKVESLKKEEEQKYLAFAQEVTDDVLARGISSERVMQRVFEGHIDRRRKDLDEIRMRNVIRDLRKNLGLRENSAERPTHDNYSNNTNNNVGRPGSRGSRVSEAGSTGHGTRSEKSSVKSVKEDSLDFSETNGTNGPSTTTLEALYHPSTQSETEMSGTLESTSTMRFGQTGEMFSTIHSEATQEEREAQLDEGDELSHTQALKQYQMSLKVKEATSGLEDTLTGGDEESSEKSVKLERPATGERREEEDDTGLSDASSLKASQNESSREDNSHRHRRRERMRKTKGTEVYSSGNSAPSGSEELASTTQSNRDTLTGASSTMPLSTPTSNGQHDLGGDTESVKSSSSSRPVAKPRARTRDRQHNVAEGSSHEEERGAEVSSGQNSGREVSEAKQEQSASSVPTDSGVASGQHNQGHDDTLEDMSEADKKTGQGHAEKGHDKNEEEDEYDDEFEEDDDDDDEEDDDQGMSTHRTSDDDF